MKIETVFKLTSDDVILAIQQYLSNYSSEFRVRFIY